VRILVTNDDGVRAPGIAALARAAVATGHDVVVVAPLIDYSGSGAAVGPVHSRAGVDYEAHTIEGLDDVPSYGIDGPPALAVILACVGGFGPRPDIVLSGINHGINVGRSAMHSGTVGAALTGAHFGLRCLAVSIRWGDDPVPWDTPKTMAAARGLRHGRLGRGGTIRSAVHTTPDAGTSLPHVSLPPGQTGTLRLDLTAPGTSTRVHPDTDAGLLAWGYASLTALVGVREAGGEADDVVDSALDALYSVTGVTSGQDLDHQEDPWEPGDFEGRSASV
jgi:5'-nucleotidase